MKNKTYQGFITELPPNSIFVYGSNHQEVPGAGAAIYAAKWGAEVGKCTGLQGKTWGIITTDLNAAKRPSVPQIFIINQIKELYEYAKQNPNTEFLVAYSGTGSNLSGFTNEELAFMWWNNGNIPKNMVFEEKFFEIIKSL